jgi:hypothetical protein
MKRAACLLGLVIVVQFCTGCATIVTGGGEDQPVRFASTPRGATVYVDDNPIGQTPISARLTRKDEHHVRIEHDGYKPYEKTIGSGFNEWMLGNVILGGLVGIGVDLLSGTNPALDTNNVHAKMIKDPTAVATAPQPVYGSTAPPAAVRPAAYQDTASPPPPPAKAAPAPVYTAPSPAAYVPPPLPAPAPVQARPAPAPAPAPTPAHQLAPAPTQTGAYKGW